MARLPSPGSDSGTWGDLLNDYLKQSLTEGGALKPNSVGAAQIQDDAITAASLADDAVTAAAILDGAVNNAKVAVGAAISADKLVDGTTNKLLTAAERTAIGTIPAQTTAINARAPYLGSRFAFFGDSITGYKTAWPYYAAALSGGKIEATQITYHSGYNSTQLLAVINEITESTTDFDVCVISCGTNDPNAALSTYSANIIAMVAAVRAAGITPVLTTVHPRVGKTVYNVTYSSWLSRWAPANGVPLVDIYSVLVDPATGEYLAGMQDGDGVHPSAAGSKAIGQAVVDTLAPLIPMKPLGVLPYSGAPNLFANSAFITGSTNPTGYGAWTGTGITNSLVTDARGFKWHRAAFSGAAAATANTGGWEIAAGTGNANFAPGDKMRFSYMSRVGQNQAYAVAGGLGVGLRIEGQIFTAGYGAFLGYAATIGAGGSWGLSQTHEGIVTLEFTVPATAGLIYWRVIGGWADGTYDYALPTLLNLTKLGIA